MKQLRYREVLNVKKDGVVIVKNGEIIGRDYDGFSSDGLCNPVLDYICLTTLTEICFMECMLKKK